MDDNTEDEKINISKDPKTIEELKKWYVDHNLPDEKTTRFFIGKDYQGARAFGIYKDEETGEFVVYKNKGDGSRAIRYSGKDEKYAVNELYKRLKDEIWNQKHNNPKNYESHDTEHNRSYSSKRKSFRPLVLFFAIFVTVSSFLVFTTVSVSKRNGYYPYKDDYYYCYNNSWFRYDDYYDEWRECSIPDKDLKKNYEEYRESTLDSSRATDFYSSSAYSTYLEEHSSSSSDSDDYSWDSSDSWDSSSTDWDSDW